jgi:hypothetical protein
MLKWIAENATSEIVNFCSIVLGIRQNFILRQIADFRKEVLSEMLSTHLSAGLASRSISRLRARMASYKQPGHLYIDVGGKFLRQCGPQIGSHLRRSWMPEG